MIIVSKSRTPLLLSMLLWAGAAWAVDVDKANQLAKGNACLSCHAVDKKLVGPSYQDVAAKYKGDAGAVAKLADKIKKGGSGVWGAIPMPPSAGLKDDDAKLLADWVLAGAPAK